MRRATANILVTLPAPMARRRLLTLAEKCDVLALQEWPGDRNVQLENLGRLHWGPWLRRKPDRGAWTFARARVGGSPIGYRNTLDETVLSCRAKILHGPGRVDPAEGRRTYLSPSFATRLKSRREEDDSIVVRYNIHLTAGVQHNKHGYRADRPKRVARHKAERRKLDELVGRDRARGYDVEVYGDTNFHQMPVVGLIGWWAVNDDAGTLGDRAIDGIWTSRRPVSVRFLPSLVPGEHRHVITTGP